MRHFVTGATGFIGGRLTRQLVSAGHQVVALVRDVDRAQALRELGVTLSKGDITDKASLRQPMEGVDGVFHCAAWYKIGAADSSMAERINVGGTRNVLETMKELGVPKGVYTSTLAVFSDTDGREVDETYYHSGPFLSEYDRTKWRAHYEVAVRMIRDGLPLVIVMPGAVYGPGDTSGIRTVFRLYLDGELPAVPAGSGFSWAHVDDVATAHRLAMERGKPGETYIVAGPSHTLVEVLQMAQRITGVRPPRMQAPRALMKAASAAAGAVGACVTLPDMYSAETLRVLSATYMGSNAKARRELGYAPRPLEDGLRETLAYEQKQR
jgi:nucleoside-diphosphate-sugar epimerase